MTTLSVLDEISRRPGTGDTIPIVNPATEEQITEFHDGGIKAVDDARARKRLQSQAYRDPCRAVNARKSCGASPI